MSKSVNSVTLLGNVGRDIEVRQTANGLLVSNINLATNERVKQGSDWKDHTEWHRVTCFARLAEIARDYLKKGSKVYISGKLRTTSWDDNGTMRYSTAILADELILLDGAGSSASGRPPQPPVDSYAGEF